MAVKKSPVAEAEEILSAPGIRKEYLFDVPLSKVHPNPWNPNVQDDRTYEATKESLTEFGFIDPITAWPHPSIKDEWMTLDGEHRDRAATEVGIVNGDLLVLHNLSEAQARRLTVILNETRGDPDVAKLGKLLSDIAELVEAGGDSMEVGYGMPYTDSEMKHLLEIGSHDWDDFQRTADENARNRIARNPDLSVTLSFKDAHGKEQFETFTGMLQRELGEDATVEDAVLHSLASACKKL